MRNRVADALLETRHLEVLDDRVLAMKKAVAAGIELMDSEVQIKYTDYSNHGYVPDMVMKWPQTGRRDRLLFLRLTPHIEELNEGLGFIERDHPVVVSLGQGALTDARSVEKQRNDLEARASETSTWITDIQGVDTVANFTENAGFADLLGKGLARGGRGLLDGPDANSLISQTSDGFAGTEDLDAQRVGAAVESIETHMDDTESGRLTRVLRALWEGHGGTGSKFPRTEGLGKLTLNDIEYILTSVPDGPDALWRILGRDLSIGQISRLRVQDPSLPLQSLVDLNMDRLTAKGLRVTQEPLKLDEDEELVPRWVVGRGCLSLRGRDWTAYLAASKKEELPLPDDDSSEILFTIGTLKKRASDIDAHVGNVVMRDHDLEFTLKSSTKHDVLHSPNLEEMAEQFGDNRVRAASVYPKGGGEAKVDFETATALGDRNTNFLATSLIQATLPLLQKLSADELKAVREKLGKSPPIEDDLFSTI